MDYKISTLKNHCKTLVSLCFFALTMARFSKNILILKDWTHKKIFLKVFRGGSDEKMGRMWLGLGIVLVGLPPLSKSKFPHFIC